jgi:hypothetical protein
MPLGLPGATAICNVFLANATGVPSLFLASVTSFMFFSSADANTSAGAPWLMLAARAELPP